MQHPFSHSTLFVLLVRECSIQQLFEELQDHIQFEAPHAAQIISSGMSKRRSEGVLWLLVAPEAISFRQRLQRIFKNDEDIFAYQEVPLSHFLDAINGVLWKRKQQEVKQERETPSEE